MSPSTFSVLFEIKSANKLSSQSLLKRAADTNPQIKMKGADERSKIWSPAFVSGVSWDHLWALGVGVSNLWPSGCMRPRMTVNAAQHKIVNLLKTFWDFHPGWCGSVVECQPVNHRVASSLPSLRHMPRLQVRSPVGGVWEATTHCCFSRFLSLPHTKKKKKAIMRFFYDYVSQCILCGPGQLFFFQGGAETPKVWIPLPWSHLYNRISRARTLSIGFGCLGPGQLGTTKRKMAGELVSNDQQLAKSNGQCVTLVCHNWTPFNFAWLQGPVFLWHFSISPLVILSSWSLHEYFSILAAQENCLRIFF